MGEGWNGGRGDEDRYGGSGGADEKIGTGIGDRVWNVGEGKTKWTGLGVECIMDGGTSVEGLSEGWVFEIYFGVLDELLTA